MTTVIVRSICTATVVEEWTFEVPEGADINRTTFEGSGGWDEAIANSTVRILSCVDEKVTDERDREVVEVRAAS